MGRASSRDGARPPVTTAADCLARTSLLIRHDIFRAAADDAIVAGLQATRVRVVADAANVSSRNAQTLITTLVGQIAMMGIQVDLAFPDVGLIGPQAPLRGTHLRQALADYLSDLIPTSPSATVTTSAPDLTILVGSTPSPRDLGLRLTGDSWRCRIDRSDREAVEPWAGDLPFGALAGGAAGAAEAFRAALPRISINVGLPIPPAPTWHLSLDRPGEIDLSVDARTGLKPPTLGLIDLISGGAITTAAIYCLLRVPAISGDLRIFEPQRLDATNLNRYPLARRSDIGTAKGAICARCATRDLQIGFEPERFDGALASLRPTADVVVGVDEIPARWSAQRATRTWLTVGATSHFFAMVSTHEAGQPCAGCAHPRDDNAPGEIPTISFVSFFAGLLQARALVLHKMGVSLPRQATYCYPLGLYGRSILPVGVAPSVDCPVGCSASRLVAKGRSWRWA